MRAVVQGMAVIREIDTARAEGQVGDGDTREGCIGLVVIRAVSGQEVGNIQLTILFAAQVY